MFRDNQQRDCNDESAKRGQAAHHAVKLHVLVRPFAGRDGHVPLEHQDGAHKHCCLADQHDPFKHELHACGVLALCVQACVQVCKAMHIGRVVHGCD
jgi:hypothetical protein